MFFLFAFQFVHYHFAPIFLIFLFFFCIILRCHYIIKKMANIQKICHDLDGEPGVDLRDMVGTQFDQPTTSSEPAPGPAGDPDTDEAVVPGDWPAAAFAPVLVPSAERHDGAGTDRTVAGTPIDAAAEHRVADAVRRAVRGWTAARQDAE